MRYLILLGAALAAPAGAQSQPTASAGVSASRVAPVAVTTMKIDPALAAQLAAAEVKRLSDAVAALTVRLAADEKELADMSVKAIFAAYAFNDLKAHYQSHYHRVNGDVGSGFTSTYARDDYISYMMPIKDDTAEYHARETTGPLP